MLSDGSSVANDAAAKPAQNIFCSIEARSSDRYLCNAVASVVVKTARETGAYCVKAILPKAHLP